MFHFMSIIISIIFDVIVVLLLRSFTNLSRNHGLFSLATPAFSNAFLIFKESASDQIEMNIRNKGISFFGEEYKLNTWQSVCASWDGANGLVQIWIDGKPSARRYCSHGTITGHALIMLGQVIAINYLSSFYKTLFLMF